MVSGEYEVVIHEQVGDLVAIKYFKKYEHFKDYETSEDLLVEDVEAGSTPCDWGLVCSQELDEIDVVTSAESFLQERADKESQEVLTPQDFGVYPSLVCLWGKEKACEELNKVIKYYPNKSGLLEGFDSKTLDEAFVWSAAPQGLQFWFRAKEQLQNL